jgi:hypothetical protein
MSFDAKLPIQSWGGARNRADRLSDHLPHAKARAIIAAAYRAQSIGKPFTRFITVHWQGAGIGDDGAAWATGRLIKLAADWAASKGERLFWAWVRENDTGDGSKGSHIHILLNAPDGLPIGRMWRRWLRRITGKPYRRNTIKSVSIGGSLRTAYTSPERYAVNLAAVLAYVCKGVHSADGAILGLPRTEPGGLIIGKRAAWSQSLGANSRFLSGNPG